MSTVSFKRAQELPIEQQQTAPVRELAVAHPPETAVAVPMTFSNPALEGEFSAHDMGIPYLSIMGPTSKGFTEHVDWLGHWVYDKQYDLGATIRVVFLKMRKYYQEKLEYDSDEIPQKWSTIAEARAAGVEHIECAELDMLVDVNGTAAVESGMVGNLAPARLTVQSTKYGRTVGVLLKDLAGWLKNDLSSGYYMMATEKKTNGKNTWYVPKLTTNGKVEADVRAEIKANFGS